MGYLRFTVVLMITIFQQQCDCTGAEGSGDDITTTGVTCPPNSHMGTIGGCDPTCSRFANPTMFCPYYEKIGCQCDAGLYPQDGTFDQSVVCVKPEDCKVKCPNHMYYEPYASGCQPTCEVPEVAKPCKIPCSPKCVCKEGSILNGKTCVKPCDCPKP